MSSPRNEQNFILESVSKYTLSQRSFTDFSTSTAVSKTVRKRFRDTATDEGSKTRGKHPLYPPVHLVYNAQQSNQTKALTS